MDVEIDQSGRVEYTSQPTVVADSEGNSVILPSKDKRILQEIYRNSGKPRVYAIQVFAALIFILLKNYPRKKIYLVIDREYPGYDDLIKSYLIQLTRKNIKVKLEKDWIDFRLIGKKSKAHDTALEAFRSKEANMQVDFKEIMSLVIQYER